MDAIQIEQIVDGALAGLRIPDPLAGWRDDIRQDAVVAVLEGVKQGRRALATIAKRAALISIRDLARQEGLEDVYASLKGDGRAPRINQIPAPQPAAPYEDDSDLAGDARQHDRQLAGQLLSQLDPQQARAVRLCIMAGKTHEQAAQVMKLSRVTVGKMVREGVEKMKVLAQNVQNVHPGGVLK